MPYASQRYSADAIISNRAALGDAASFGLSKTPNGQASGRESQFRMSDPVLHSSLSRLTSATNPESGTISYSYDPNGNLTSKIDARSITSTYTYDALNRVTTRSYNDTPQTPTVNYTYGLTAPKVGKLTKVSSSVSTTEYTSFDILGRVTASKQTTDGVEYGGSGSPAAMTYTYNLSGAMIEQQYPSGRVVMNTLDASGDLSMVTSKENSSAIFKTYVNDFTYSAAGAVTSLKLGNGKFESTQFNSRLQPTQIALGASVGDTSSLKLDYSYGDWNGGSIDATKNNGNIVQQVITTPTVGSSTGFTATQKYYYDSLNRIDDSTETISSTQTWRQDFTYDRYGNRRFNETNTSMPASFSNQALTNPTISTSNNRLTSTGWAYDASGNTTGDPQSRTFIYDGENKQVEVKNSSSATIGQYSYDGDGRRVKKYVPSTGETTIFVYDAAGKQIAEYSTIVADSSSAKVAYLTNDHLGSPRISTDVTGAVTSRHDYHPFGEEVAAGRSSHAEYTPDSVRKQFTGYERDIESDLDFAQARMYNPKHGRFTAVDPIMITKNRLRDPQSINLYAYTRNNPLKYVDPTGEYFVGTDGKRVDVTVRDGMISVGRNASKDLQRMASLINEKGSGTSLSQFQAIAGNDTKVNFRIETNPQKDRPGLLGLHQAHDKDGKALNWEANTGGTGKFDGTPAYIKDKDGNQIYQESTITIFEGNIENSLSGLRQNYQDAELTTQEYMVSTFGHEGDHNTNQEAINAIRDRQEGRPNNFNVETPAYRVTDQSLREIRENRRLPGCFVF